MAVPKRKVRKKHGRYRSGLEKKFAEILQDNKIPYKYETTKLTYVQPQSNHTYLVDFNVGTLYVETKGRLTAADRKKMRLIHEQRPDIDLVMVFDRGNKKINTGSKTTYAMWCEKNGIAHLDINDIKENPECLLSIARNGVDGNLKTRRLRKKMH